MGCLLKNRPTNYKSLLESYYGKPKEFVKIEKLLEKVIVMVEDQMTQPVKSIDINKSKEIKEIENLFTKFFGNYKTSITIYSAALPVNFGRPNAYTIPSSMVYFRRKDPNKPYKASAKDLYINVNIDMGLIYAFKLTAEELMGIILHEIGHDFDASLFHLLTYVNIGIFFDNTGMTGLNNIFSFLITEPMSKIFQFGNRFVSQIPLLNNIVTTLSLAWFDFNSFLGTLTALNVIARLMNPIYLINLINPANLFGYAGEKYADSFAASYGYAVPLSSALNKFETAEKRGCVLDSAVKTIPLINVFYNYNNVMIKLCTAFLDPHPNTYTRIQSQLNKLKRDLNDPSINKNIRNDLKKEIASLEKFIDNEVLNEDELTKKGQVFTYLYGLTIMKVFDGKVDFRECFEEIWRHEE